MKFTKEDACKLGLTNIDSTQTKNKGYSSRSPLAVRGMSIIGVLIFVTRFIKRTEQRLVGLIFVSK